VTSPPKPLQASPLGTVSTGRNLLKSGSFYIDRSPVSNSFNSRLGELTEGRAVLRAIRQHSQRFFVGGSIEPRRRTGWLNLARPKS
jgi:hypothetical protein